jgi:hypothetical protein
MNSNTELGKDSIKGGIFFGSNLTPSGTFENIPETVDSTQLNISNEPRITMTLALIKEQLQNNAKLKNQTSQDPLSDQAINTFLTNYVQLLIDYRDLRNLVFFGSSYVEMKYQIDYLKQYYPYKSYIARLTSDPDLEMIYFSGQTEIIFKLIDILQPANFYFDTTGRTLWADQSNKPTYELLNKIDERFPILQFINNIILEIFNTTILSPGVFRIDFHRNINGIYYGINTIENNLILTIIDSNDNIKGTGIISNINQYPNYTKVDITINPLPATISISAPTVITSPNHGLTNNISIRFSTTGTLPTGITAGTTYYIKNATANTFNISTTITPGTLINTFGIQSGTHTFTIVVENNDLVILPSNICSFIVDGIYSINNLIEYKPNDTQLYKGFLISPILQNLIDFETSLDGIKKILLNPLNPTPWPRWPITNNIRIEGTDYTNWLLNPNNLILNYNPDKDGLVSDPELEFNMVSALTLDDGQTNQLLLRAIPHRLVDELNDIDDRYFTRFIWLAGKMFDTIKVYIDFLKFTHTLNYTPYNQLSPEFYKQYAEHYGFNLLDEDNINFAQTLIFTEPGLAYDAQYNAIYNNQLSAQTLKQLQYERQKRLLIHLMYLYQKKGTIQCIEYLTNLLGSPQGLVIIEEYAIVKNTGQKIVDNIKINIPTYTFEIDEAYLVNPNDINDPVNLPYVYKIALNNDHIDNLREISINIDVLGAILADILKYGQIIYPYGLFKEKTFATLQNSNEDFYLLPLTFPDKFSGVTVTFNIPKNGLKYGWGNNEDEVSFNLVSLFKIAAIDYSTHINSIGTSDLIGPYTDIYINTINNYTPTQIYIYGATEIIPDGLYNVLNIIEIVGQLVISIDFISSSATYLGLGSIIGPYPKLLNKTFKFNYRISPIYLNFLNDQTCLLKDELIVYNAIVSFIIPDNIDIGIRDTQLLNVKLTDAINNSIIIGSTTWNAGISLEENIINLTDNINQINTTPNFFSYYIPITNGFLVTVIFDITSTINNQPYNLIVETNSFNDVEITPLPVLVSTYSPSNETDEYIIARLEGKDLVIRLKMVDENTGIPVERIAIFYNIFTNDGLNHLLKLIYRFEGVEVYLDYKYLGLARWKALPTYPPPPPYGWTARQIPKFLFNFLTITPLPATLAAAPDKLPTWWDLFVGWPKGIEMYINKITISEPTFVTESDINDDISGINSERWIFDFNNQIKDSNTKLYITDRISIEAVYKAPYPLPVWTDPTLPADLSAFFVDNYSHVNLTSKNLYNSEVNFLQSIADFFIIPANEFYTIETLFKHNAWSSTLHTDYTYYNFDKVYDNYYTFAQQVLNFINLNAFVELIEEKFQPLIRQLIPIVINISTFGKLLRNNIAKVRYPFAHFNCFGHYCKSKAIGSFKISNGQNGQPSFQIKLVSFQSDIFEIPDNISPIVIKLVDTHDLLTGSTITITDILGCTAANGTWTITVIDDYSFSLDGSTWNAPWTGGGTIKFLNTTLGTYTWTGSNTLTAEVIAAGINTLFPGGQIIATTDLNVVILEIDVKGYWLLINQNINETSFEISSTSPIEISEIHNPSGGHVQTSGNECIVLEYIAKKPITPALGMFVFYESEGAMPFYIYFESEYDPTNLLTYPIYID